MEEFVLCFKDSNLLNLLYGFGRNVLKDCVSLYKYISFKETSYSPPISIQEFSDDNVGFICEYKNSFYLKLSKFLNLSLFGFLDISFI